MPNHSPFFWWLRHVLLALMAVFFTAFGIHLLIAAYGLEDPFHFVMTFFASNLIILISATLLAGFVIRMVAAVRRGKDVINESPSTDPG